MTVPCKQKATSEFGLLFIFNLPQAGLQVVGLEICAELFHLEHTVNQGRMIEFPALVFSDLLESLLSRSHEGQLHAEVMKALKNRFLMFFDARYYTLIALRKLFRFGGQDFHKSC